ncbi:MAG: DUF3298 and DUF4163 domain-containing protein [Eubacteriales bacterium]|nr:DUF3298 and DUF4163 domain-containing protein [Eubacteriales bacterium]
MRKHNLHIGKAGAAILAAAFLFSAAACQTSDSTRQTSAAGSEPAVSETASGTAAETNTPETESQTVPAETGTASEETTDGSTPVSADSLLESNQNTAIRVSITTEQKQYPEDGTPRLETSVDSIRIADSGYDTLQAALNQDSREQAQLTADEAGSLIADPYMEETAETGETAVQDTPLYALSSTVVMKRADDRIFSYLRSSYSYTGGAHPNTYLSGYTFDTASGNQLRLTDIAADYDGLYEYVCSMLETYARNPDYPFFDGYEDTVREVFYGASASDDAENTNPDAATVQWFMDDTGVTILFNAYDLGPYAMGAVAVPVPFAQQSALFIDGLD